MMLAEEARVPQDCHRPMSTHGEFGRKDEGKDRTTAEARSTSSTTVGEHKIVRERAVVNDVVLDSLSLR